MDVLEYLVMIGETGKRLESVVADGYFTYTIIHAIVCTTRKSLP